jgi:uncharacterized protein (DUF2267 family)
MTKGLAPKHPDAPSWQIIDTDQGKVRVNPKTGETLPLMYGGAQVAGAADKPTEDQLKATGWLVQSKNAFQNMKKAIKDNSNASDPSLAASFPMVGGVAANVFATDPQQRFRQGALSLSEALLRAATGAGMNKDEAIQKVRELTPVVGDTTDNIDQKMAAIPLYIASLEYRAGKKGAAAAASIMETPPPSAGDLYKQYGLTHR